MFWTTTAYAMSQGGQGGENDPLMSLLPLILMFAVFYFLLIRPQQKRAKEHKALVESLRKGDDVITNGGLCGRIVDTQEETVTVDLGETKVTVLRSAIASMPLRQSKEKAKPAKKDGKKAEKKPEEPAAKSDDSADTTDE